MKLRNKLGALLGAGLLTFAVAGVAFASTDLLAGQVGITLGEKTGTTDQCAGVEVGAGEAVLHFVLTQTADSDGSFDATFSNPVGSAHADNADGKQGGNLDWTVTITGDANTVLESATTDATGDNLVLSHVCFGAPVATETPAAPTPTPAAPTETPNLGGGGDTLAPTQPPTDTLGNISSGPSDGAWLLVVALGVLLASVVVLTPARAKSRR